MTALDIWLLMAKVILFLELLEYSIVLHIRFSNVQHPKLDYRWKRGKCTRINLPMKKVKLDDKEIEEMIMVKCKKIDSQALLGFLIGTILFNLAYFTYYLCK